MRKRRRGIAFQIPRNAMNARKRASGITQLMQKNGGCLKIDGKEYYYHYNDKRWKIMDDPNPPMGKSFPPVVPAVTLISVYCSITTLDHS